MAGFGSTQYELKCKGCSRIATKLVPINDNGKGRKVCVQCKRKERAKTKPNKIVFGIEFK